PLLTLRTARFHFFISMLHPPPPSTLFPYTTLFRSECSPTETDSKLLTLIGFYSRPQMCLRANVSIKSSASSSSHGSPTHPYKVADRKSTRLNSSHLVISYAVFCLKKKKRKKNDS